MHRRPFGSALVAGALVLAACTGGRHASAPPIDTTPPSVRASPAGGTFAAAVTVALLCDDGAGSGCAAVHFTTDGSPPTVASPAYTAPIAVASTGQLRFLGIDAAGNASAIETETYAIAAANGEIAAIRAAPDGRIELPVTAATVTYLKPAVGNEPAGFFVQGDPPGAGVFVAIEPVRLSPPPAPGDAVSFTAAAKQRVGGVVEITELSGFAVVASGRAVEPLRVDVSAVAELPAHVGEYESALVSITGSVTGPFISKGTGFVGAPLATAGTPGSPSLSVRVPVAVADGADLVAGCSVTVRAPLWRSSGEVQATAWASADLTLAACPAPKVLSALATSPTDVTVELDRHVDPGSVAADGSQFAFTNGLVASAAGASGRSVRLTTSAQVAAQPYTVTAAGVRDTIGTPIDGAANAAPFRGWQRPAVLRITEVAANTINGRDLVELLVLQAGTTAGMRLVQDSATVLATLPDVDVATGDLVVVHLNPALGGTLDAPASETLAKDQYPSVTYAWNHDTAWDFHGGATRIGYANRVLRIEDPSGATQDGAAFASRALSTPPASYPAALQQLQADGHWLPADCGGAPCTYDSIPSATEVSANWEGLTSDRSITVRRTAPTLDGDRASDWAVGPSSFGTL